MGREKIEHRELTAEEKARAHGLMEEYAWLAKDVIHKCSYKFGSLLPGHDVTLSIAYLGLCEAVTRYVELGYDLPKPRERGYLAKAIENALIDHIRERKRARNARMRAEQESGS